MGITAAVAAEKIIAATKYVAYYNPTLREEYLYVMSKVVLLFNGSRDHNV